MSEESDNTTIPRSRSMDTLGNTVRTNTSPLLNSSPPLTPPTTAKQPGWLKRTSTGAKQGINNAWSATKQFGKDTWSGAKQSLGNVYNTMINERGESIGTGLSTFGSTMLLNAPKAATWSGMLSNIALGVGSSMLGAKVHNQYEKLKDKKIRENNELLLNANKNTTTENSGRKRSNSLSYGSSPPNIMSLYTPNVAASGGGRKKLIFSTPYAHTFNIPPAAPPKKSKPKLKKGEILYHGRVKRTK